MEKPGNTVIGGLSGAAILALLLGISSSKPPASAASSKPSSPSAKVASHVTPRESVTLDDSGPWVALCQEYWTSADWEASPVSWSADPPEANPDATEITTHGKAEDQKIPVIAYPHDPNLTKCKAPNEKITTIIATAPDPVASHLQLDFDRSIAAFQRAAGFMGYDFQRYWLPWNTSSSGSEKPGENIDAETRLRLQQPGVMIFRKSADRRSATDDRLAVFIVGETPTGGVDRWQFNNALLYASQLSTPGAADNDVNIAGPQFSASLRGMADVLISRQETEGRSFLYRVYSPSASSDSLLDDFSSRLRKHNIEHDLVGFEATYQSSLKLLCKLLHTYGYRSRDLAVLVEDESAFGSAVAKTDRANIADSSDAGQNANSAAPESDDDTDLASILTLQFPRDLSAIRNAPDTQPQPAQQNAVPSLGVPLSLREQAGGGLDSPPAFAQEQSAAALDRELQAIVRTLHANQTQVVILAVSNPLDRVYLFDYLHRAVPDVRLATLDSDVLTLGRPRYVDLRGTISVTALPLSNTTEVIVRPRLSDDQHKVHEEFNSTPQAGAYLSVLSLLSDPSLRPPIPYTPNNCASITFVGKDGFQPGKLRHVVEQGCKLPERPGIARVQSGVAMIPWSWTVFSSLSLILAGYFIYWCRRNVLSLHPVVATGWLPRLIAVRKDSKHHFEKLLVLFCISNQLLLLQWMVVTATFGSAFAIVAARDIWTLRELWQCFKLVQLANLILLPGILVMTLDSSVRLAVRLVREYAARPTTQETKSWPSLFWGTFPIASVYLVATAVMWWRVLGAQRWDVDQIIALRSIDLLGGLSPLAMIASVLLAYTLWGYSQLQRLTMMESREVLLDFRSPVANPQFNEVLSPFETLHDNFHAEVDYSSKMKLHLDTGLLAVIVCSLLRLNVALRGIDGIWLCYWSIVFGLGMLVVMLSVSNHQMWAVWRCLGKILRFLNATPIRDVFARLPKEISSMRIWRIGMGRQSLAIQRRTLMVLKTVACGVPVTALAKSATGAQQTAITVQPKETEAKLDEALSILQRVESGDCGVSDEEVWKLRLALNMMLPETISLLRQDVKDPLSAQPLGTYLAYRFLALIQYALLQIRTMVLLQVFGFACVVICVSMYPFQGRQSLSMLLTMLFFGLFAILGLLFSQMEANPILRRLEQPEGESKDSGFSFLRVTGKLIAVGGVPLIAVLASQFPSLANFFSTWLSPVSEALK